MVLLYILAFVYGSVGLVYALYVMFNGMDPWYMFPLNLVFGPAVLLYNYYKYVVRKKFPRIK